MGKESRKRKSGSNWMCIWPISYICVKHDREQGLLGALKTE
jgi:hypothetical protein